MTEDDKQAEPVDVHVGDVMRRRRKALGMLQEELAAAMKVSPQQVQKYETAATRISASKLFLAARALKVSTGYFFSEIEKADAASEIDEIESKVTAFIKSDDGRELAILFPRIADEAVRTHFLNLARAMANSDQTGTLTA